MREGVTQPICIKPSAPVRARVAHWFVLWFAGGGLGFFLYVCMHACTLRCVAHFGRANVRTGGLKLKWNIKFKRINNVERPTRGVEIHSASAHR